MNMQRLLACSFLVLLSACSAECSCNGGDDDEDGTTSQGGGSPTGQGGATGTGGEGGTDTGTGGQGTGGEGTGGEGGGTTGGVQFRFAHLSPDSAAVNFCLVDAESGEEVGPLFDEAGVEFQGISEYSGVHSGSYSVVVTAPGATDCGTALLTADLGVLALGDARTVAVVGLAGADEGADDALALQAYTDDLSAPAAGKMHARFIHAAPGAPEVDIGYVDDTDTFVPVWEGASFPNDAGYVEIDAFDTLTLEARAAGTDVVLLGGIEVTGAEGSIVEGFAVGSVETGVDVVTLTTEAPAAP